MFKCLTYYCSFILILFPFIITSELSAREVRRITPPKLSAAHLGRKLLCCRPMRRETPRMTVEKIGKQVIAHNYGHGGSGWTLGPGSAAYVNNMLIQSKYASDLKKNTPITIIGAGALGFFTAYDLLQKGYTNLTIVADRFEHLTSDNAAGLIAPVSMDNAPEMQKVVDKIGVDAYKFFKLIAERKNPHFLRQGAVIVPTYFENRNDSGLEPYVGKVMQPAKDVILDFGNGTKREMVAYDDGIFVNVSVMMSNLRLYLRKKKVEFVKMKVHQFSDIKSKYVINCSGLGARELNNDTQLVSVQGHLLMLKDQNPKDLQYMILVYFKEDIAKSGHKIKRSFYIFPKQLPNTAVNDVGVIGGTFVEGATPDTPNTEEFDTMLESAKLFYGIQ